MSLPPVSANFIPFLSKKTILPNAYSHREAQIEDYNQKAIELFEEGHFEQAQELWEKAIEIMEDSKKYDEDYPAYEEGYKTAEEQLGIPSVEGYTEKTEIERTYQKAIVLFRSKKYVAAKHLFERVEAKTPDYKATRNYLTILSHKIKKVQQSLSDDKFKKSALARRAEREEWKRILEDSQKELNKNLAEQVAPLYDDAIQFYKKRNFKLAKDYFKEINHILPNYKDTMKYLTRIDADIREEDQRRLEEANKKEILARKKEQDEWQRVITESERKLETKLKEQAEVIYQEAQHYYKEREFELAKNRFEDVKHIDPNYKATDKYLARIDQDIRMEVERAEQARLHQIARKKKLAKEEREREERRVATLQAAEEKERVRRFQEEVTRRRKEREDWLKILRESERERQRNLEQQAEFVYNEAVQYYKRREFDHAKADFLEVERIIPGYKATEKYLARIDHDIGEEQRRRLAQQHRTQERQIRNERLIALEHQQEEHHKRAVEDKKRLLEFQAKAQAREKQRAEWNRILRENEQERQKRLHQEAGFIYKEAIRSYKNQDWERAQEGFIDVQQIIPDYKKAEDYLARIDRAIVKAEQKRRAQTEKLKEQRWKEEALVRKQDEERRIRAFEADRKRQEKRQQEHAQAVYSFAESLYKRGSYVQAKEKFIEVESILPEYKSTERYLARIDDDIDEAQRRDRREQQVALDRQAREEKIKQLEEEKRLKKLFNEEEDQRLAALRKKASVRKEERIAWENTMKAVEKENQKRLERQAELIYQEGLRYYKAGWYRQAKTSFEEVEAAVPGYKSAKKYIARSNKRIAKEQKTREDSEAKIAAFKEEEQGRAVTLKSQAQKQERTWKTDPDRPSSVSSGDYSIPEPNGTKVISKAVKGRERARSQEAEIKYREALSSYKAKNFIEAKLKFIEVESFSPGYKSTLDYLKNIDAKIMEQKEQTDRAYSPPAPANRGQMIEQALRQQERTRETQMGEEVSSQEMVQEESQRPDVYFDQQYFTQDRRRELKTQRRIVQQQYDKQFRQLYDRAVRLYRDGAYIEAQKLFIQIERMKPGYKRAASYIKKANAKIKKGLHKERSSNVAQSPDIQTRDDIIGEALDAFDKRL